MSKLEILGAGSGEVTGSMSVFTTRSKGRLLIDCGKRQEQENGRFDRREKGIPGLNLTEKLSAVVVTHGHLDHVGMLPRLESIGESNGEAVPIYMTPATFELAQIVLKDAERLSKGFYATGSVDAVLRRTIRVPYNSPVVVDGGVTFTFTDAGHILGSSSLVVDEKGGDRIVFSGDLGNNNLSRLVKPTEMIKGGANIAVMETTYGDRNHAEESPVEVIMEAIEMIKKTGGTLLIPAFAIDRVQAVLNILKKLYKNNKMLGVQTFLDTPMGMAATKVYDKYITLLNDQVREKADPFDFKGLRRITTAEESRKIRNQAGAKIIIAGSGMMTGGRILYHAQEHLRDPKSVILFVGFAAEGTPARMIMDGEKYVEVADSQILVNGTVLKTSSMSAHADQRQLSDWLGNLQGGDRRLRTVVNLHGNNEARNAFAEKVRSELEIDDVLLPNIGDVIDFDQNRHPRAA